MSAGAVRGNGLMSLSTVDPGRELDRPSVRRNDAHMGIREIEVLRADLDMVSSAEATDLAQPLVEMYRGSITSGDHLRLPLLTNHDGPSLRAAVARVLETDTSAMAAGSREDVLKEAKMLRVLRALEGAVAQIQRQAALTGTKY